MQTFFSDTDYAAYRDRIAEGCAKADVAVLAYCLMPNHVHLILVPNDERGLARALTRAHQTYSWWVNRRQGWTGHLWQSRFHSFAMDDDHTLQAVRYVELNPVRARLCMEPGDWKWSSAPARLSQKSDALVTAERLQPVDRVGDWAQFLSRDLDADALAAQRDHQLSGQPLGHPAFVAGLERLTRRTLSPRPRGRPPSLARSELAPSHPSSLPIDL